MQRDSVQKIYILAKSKKEINLKPVGQNALLE